MNGRAGAWTDGALFHKLLDETVDLMRETLSYIARVEAMATPVGCLADRRERLAVVRECSTMTAHLTAVMSWLLMHQALAEKPSATAPPVSRPTPFLVAVSSFPPLTTGQPLDPRGEALKTRTATLYGRVHRLEEQLSVWENSRPGGHAGFQS